MFEGAFSPVHILIVGVVALLVLGPDKLPDAARTAAKAWRQFSEVRDVLVDHVHDLAHEVIPPGLGAEDQSGEAAQGATPIGTATDVAAAEAEDGSSEGDVGSPSPPST